MEQINKNDYSFKSLSQIEKMKSYDKQLITRFIETIKTNWNDCLYREIIDHITSKNHICFLLTARNNMLNQYTFPKSIAKDGVSGVSPLKMELIGYIIIYEPHFYKPFSSYKDCRFIYLVDTFIPKLNICMFMIEKLEKRFKTILLPYNIAKGARDYWKKYFAKKFNIQTKNDIEEFKKKHCLMNYWADDLYE